MIRPLSNPEFLRLFSPQRVREALRRCASNPPLTNEIYLRICTGEAKRKGHHSWLIRQKMWHIGQATLYGHAGMKAVKTLRKMRAG